MKKPKANAPSLFSDEELEQVERYAQIKPKTPVCAKGSDIDIQMEGSKNSPAERGFTALKHALENCVNEDGLSLWQVLLDAKAAGASRIMFI